MRLKNDLATHDIDGTQFLVPMGAEAIQCIVRSNKTAAFIVNCLKEETAEEAIVDKMCAKYDAPRAQIAADVSECLAVLRRIGALEE